MPQYKLYTNLDVQAYARSKQFANLIAGFNVSVSEHSTPFILCRDGSYTAATNNIVLVFEEESEQTSFMLKYGHDIKRYMDKLTITTNILASLTFRKHLLTIIHGYDVDIVDDGAHYGEHYLWQLKFNSGEDYIAFVLKYGTDITYRTIGL